MIKSTSNKCLQSRTMISHTWCQGLMNSYIPRWATRERQFWRLSPELLLLAVEPVRQKGANPTMIPHPKTDTDQPVAANSLEENLVPSRGYRPCAGETFKNRRQKHLKSHCLHGKISNVCSIRVGSNKAIAWKHLLSISVRDDVTMARTLGKQGSR